MLYILVGIITLIILTFIGYISHLWFHSKSSGPFYRSHLTHHYTLYPKTDLISKPTEGYRSAGKDNTTYLFALIFAPLVLTCLGLTIFSVIPIWIGLLILLEMFLISIVNETMHSEFHLPNGFWHHFWFFKRLQKLHFLHHSFVLRNLGIYSYTWDRIFGTYRDKLK
jgi:sterol desaturase/sphingolipid hydroxylase (fatty acid hydroxylase superfamily)